MKTRQLLALLSAFAALSVGQTIPNNGIRLDGSFNTPYISESGGTAYLQISLKTGNFNLHNTRKPMNIAVVIDRSGSMDDERKMDYAKKAFRRLIEQLEPRDILSVIVYDDKIDVLRSARRIGNDKQSILRILDEISPRNSTNLGGGLIVGLHQAEKNIRKEFVNRVILLSDGLANIGITDPNLLNSIAKEFRRKGVSISTMGVGLDYNENLMMSLAESGGGNYYFIEQPNMLASIVRKEFESVSAVVAQNAVIQLKLDANVRIQDIIGCEFTSSENDYRISIGDLYANDTRELTVELEIPKGKNSFTAARGYLEYSSDKITGTAPSFAVDIQYTKDFTLIEKNRNMEAQAKADVAISTRSVERAMQALDEGNQTAAAKAMQEAEAAVSSSPASGAAITDQRARIEQYQSILKDEKDSRKAKKSIQYDNYKTQKKK